MAPSSVAVDPFSQSWIDMIYETNDEFEVDGALHVISTWRTENETIISAPLTGDRASTLINTLSSNTECLCA